MVNAPVENDLSKQIKVTEVISSLPEYTATKQLTAMGSVAQGARVNGVTTSQLSSAAFAQGQFFKAFAKVDFNSLQTTKNPDGQEIWSYEKNIDGTAHKLSMNKQNMLESIKLTEVQNQAEIDTIAKKYNIKATDAYITVDGKKYFIRMSIPMHFSAGDSDNVFLDTAIFVFGSLGLSAAIAGVATQFGIGAFASVMSNINTQLFQVLWSAISGVFQLSYVFMQAFVGGVIGGEGIAAAFAAGQLAVGEALAEGVFAAITTTALAYTVIGILIIAAIYLIMNYVLHYSYQNVYIFNLTKYDLDFDFGYVYEGADHNVMSKHIPAIKDAAGPGGIDLGSKYSATGFRFQSDSQFYGIGYALSLTLKEKGTQTVHKKMACMFDIPYLGENSLKATATYPANIKDFYNKNEGAVKQTQNSDSDDELELIVTYDFLSGKHRDPETGNQDYIYNSLIIVRDKVPAFTVTPAALLSDNGYLSIPSNSAYNFGSRGFTVEAWIKPSGPGTIFGKKSTGGGSSSCSGFLVVLQPNGALKFATDNGYGYSQIMSNANNIMDGQWHHISAVRSGSSLLVYVDGKAVSATPSGSLPSPLGVSNGLDLLLGSVQQNQEPYIHYLGSMSEVRVWNIGLNSSQIQQGMNSKLVGTEKGLVGYWPLHANEVDLSPTKNNAQLIGDVTFK